MGRGDRAGLFARFVLEELIPYIQSSYAWSVLPKSVMPVFRLGFDGAGHGLDPSRGIYKGRYFSASLWWRMIDQEEPDWR